MGPHSGARAPLGGAAPRAAVPGDRALLDAARHEPDAALPHGHGTGDTVGAHARHPGTAGPHRLRTVVRPPDELLTHRSDLSAEGSSHGAPDASTRRRRVCRAPTLGS